MKSVWIPLLSLCLFFTAGDTSAQAPERRAVDVELCLAVDGSGSIEDDEFAFQRQAYAQALTDAKVVDIVTSGFNGGIAVALMEWGGPTSLHPIVDWTLIDGPQPAADFAEALLAAPRRATGWNSISNAIAFCQQWIESNDFEGFRKVIDVSGDAGQFGGMPLELARSLAVEAGMVINALALNYRSGGMTGPGGMPLSEHFYRDVIGGPGAFALTVDSEDEFLDALIRKLILEIASLPVTPQAN